MLILSSSTSVSTKTYFPSPELQDSLSEPFSHPPRANLNPVTPGECQLIHLPSLMAITSISTYQKPVTAGMDEKQRYSYKPKTERHSYWGEKNRDIEVSILPRERGTEDPLNSGEGTEHQLQNQATFCLWKAVSGTIHCRHLISSKV